MIKKIIFLFKSNTNIKLILLFLFQKIINIFLKKKIKHEKKYFLNLISNLKISTEFFSVNAYNFLHHLSSLKEDFKYLEIGSFEGGSAIYISNRFQNSKIFCIDNWVKTDDGYGNLDFNNVEKNFDYNILKSTNIKKIKKTSDNFFLNNSHNFDVIYIDGYHKCNQVFKDCVNSWKILNVHGILVCDDYIWDHYNELEKNPCFAINQFLNSINNFKVLQVSKSEIFIKKT